LTGAKWASSAELKAIVLNRLMAFRKPVRFTELWQESEQDMSRAAFVKVLRDLEEEGAIRRRFLGKKHVEYAPNPKHSLVAQRLKPLRKFEGKLRQYLVEYRELMRRSAELAREPSRDSGGAVKAAVYYSAWLLSQATISVSFIQASIYAKHGEDPIVQSFSPEILKQLHRAQEPWLRISFKRNQALCFEAMKEWLEDMEKIRDQRIEATSSPEA